MGFFFFFSPCDAHPECVNVKAASKAHVCYPAHMFPQSSTHAREKAGGGACRQADPGQQGLFDQRSGPSGHWVLDCLRNGRELQRNKSPLYFTHMFRCTKINCTRKARKINSSCGKGEILKLMSGGGYQNDPKGADDLPLKSSPAGRRTSVTCTKGRLTAERVR